VESIRWKRNSSNYREINVKRDKPVSVELIRRTIKKTKLQYLVVEEEQKLSKRGKEKRLQYCRKNLKTNWKLILFTMFQLPSGRHKQWQDPKNRLKN